MMQEEITALQKLINTAIEFAVKYSFQVVGAIIVLAIGLIVANWVSRFLLKFFEQKKLDITLSKFLTGVVRISILSFALIIALGKFGITIAPFIAALSAMAFGTSFAIQGPLSNYGAGLSIILTRPFAVGDTIAVAGVSGVVEEVKLACTILRGGDGAQITIPNKHIVGETVYNSRGHRMVEGAIGVSYENDPQSAVQVLEQALKQFREIVTNPKPQIGIKEFADSAINLGYRYWVPTAQGAQIAGAVNLAIYKALQNAGIKIPYPQREVHIVSQSNQTPSL